MYKPLPTTISAALLWTLAAGANVAPDPGTRPTHKPPATSAAHEAIAVAPVAAPSVSHVPTTDPSVPAAAEVFKARPVSRPEEMSPTF